MNRPLGLGLVLLAATGLLAPGASAASSGIRFAAPVFVDRTLPGGEPTVALDPRTGRLLYAAHLGMTQVDAVSTGGATVVTSTATSYRNQVLLWSSTDSGRTWHRMTQPNGFTTSPTSGSGFSDPDLSVGPDGRAYLTMINPGADALASTADGGESWQGTPQCHEGDRPFIAAGRANELFLATSDDVYGEVVAASLDGGKSCLTATASAATDDGHGTGKPVYVTRTDTLLLPWMSYDGTTVGVARLTNPGERFAAGNPKDLTPITVAKNTTLGGHWPSLAADSAGTLYLVWDTSPGAPTCIGVDLNPTLRNHILLSTSTDGGEHWSRPKALTDGRTTALWPWVVAGSGGRAFVAWYEYDRVVKPFCAPDDAALRVMGASLQLRGRSTVATVVPVSGRPIHFGDTCSGLGCIALRGDRRLGDLFTVATDRAGCVVVATADTTLKDPTTGGASPWSQPLFIRQASGPSLTTGRPCKP